MKDVFGLVQRFARQLVRKKPHYCALVNSHGDDIDMGTMYKTNGQTCKQLEVIFVKPFLHVTLVGVSDASACGRDMCVLRLGS